MAKTKTVDKCLRCGSEDLVTIDTKATEWYVKFTFKCLGCLLIYDEVYDKEASVN